MTTYLTEDLELYTRESLMQHIRVDTQKVTWLLHQLDWPDAYCTRSTTTYRSQPYYGIAVDRCHLRIVGEGPADLLGNIWPDSGIYLTRKGDLVQTAHNGTGRCPLPLAGQNDHRLYVIADVLETIIQELLPWLRATTLR